MKTVVRNELLATRQILQNIKGELQMFEADLSEYSSFELFQMLYLALGGCDNMPEPQRTQTRTLYWELYNRHADDL